MGNKKDGPRCAIGDDFTGVQKIMHDMIMSNELYEGYGAYKVSYADTKDPDNKSGLSFGVNQMDMSQDSKAVLIFIKIIENAKDKSGNLIVNSNIALAIRGADNFNLETILKTPEQVFGKNLSLVNAALSSEYGIKTINNTYVDALIHDMAHVDKAISLIKNPAAKSFYDTDYGKTLLYDYHNQYGLTLGKKGVFINDYINGDYNGTERTDCSTKKTYSAPTDHYGLEDHVKYLHSTEQYSKTPKMVDDRLGKTLKLLDSYGLNEGAVIKKTGSELIENYPLNDDDLCFYIKDGMCIFGKEPGSGYDIKYDPIMMNILSQPTEIVEAQLSFLNLDSSYYPSSNITNNFINESSSSSLFNFFEPYIPPSYNLIDSYMPPITYVEPYNINNNYFDITNYQVPIDSNFGLGNTNWGSGGGYFGGGGSNFGNGWFFSMHSKDSLLSDTNSELKIKPYALNDVLDLNSYSEDVFNILLGMTTVNVINSLEHYEGFQEPINQDPLRDFFELAAVTA